MGIKSSLQRVLDHAQFRYDVFPRLQYQPLPWLGYAEAGRGSGTTERWSAIQSHLPAKAASTAIDIGCNVGFFVFSLAQQGYVVLGVEGDDRYFRIARHAAKRIGEGKVGLLNVYLTEENLALIPHMDVTIFLSVFHHWSRYFGWQTAGEMLSNLWSKCDDRMFFETGEDEMPGEYNLPRMGPDSAKWLRSFLLDRCADSEVELIGTFKAFAPGGNEKEKVVTRNLFVVRRVSAR